MKALWMILGGLGAAAFLFADRERTLKPGNVYRIQLEITDAPENKWKDGAGSTAAVTELLKKDGARNIEGPTKIGESSVEKSMGGTFYAQTYRWVYELRPQTESAFVPRGELLFREYRRKILDRTPS